MLKKKCSSCGRSFPLTGSGNRQKYCSKTCRNHGDVGLPTTGTEVGSNVLKSKAAKTGFEDAWVARLSRLEMEGPIALLVGDELFRLWPSETTKTADARHWRMSVKGVRDHAVRVPPPRKEKPVTSGKGFRVRLVLEMEAPAIGCGSRLVTVQFRRVKRTKKVERVVVLHCAGYSDTMTREAFKELVASNKRYRNQRKPVLRLVVNNPPRADTRSEAALLELGRRGFSGSAMLRDRSGRVRGLLQVWSPSNPPSDNTLTPAQLAFSALSLPTSNCL